MYQLPNNDLFYEFRHLKVQNTFPQSPATIKSQTESQKPKEDKKEHKIKTQALIGSIIGTLIPIAFMVKSQKCKESLLKKLINIEYCDTKALLSMAFCSVFGGVTGGIIADKGKNSWDKIKEANFQLISNVLFPVLLIKQFRNLSKKLTQNCGKLGKTIGTSVAIISGVGLGVTSGAFVSNLINNKLIKKGDKYYRKINYKDFLVHVDDLPTALAISGVAHVDKLLPFLLVMRGYEAGEK